MTNRWIYHLSRSKDWLWAKRTASYNGSKEDIADGFLHFSTAHQVEESALKHRTGEHNIILLEVDAFKLGPALRWETSRNSQKFINVTFPTSRNQQNLVYNLGQIASFSWYLLNHLHTLPNSCLCVV